MSDETKPTIETILERINSHHAETISAINELRTDLRTMERQMRVLNNNMLTIAGRQEHIEDRVEKLEQHPA